MAKKRGRGPSREDLELWQRVTAGADPLHRRPSPAPLEPARPKPKPHEVKHSSLPEFRVGERAAPEPPGHDIAASLSDRFAHAPVRMDRKSFTKMTRGKLRPEGRIDLHGMTLAAAHPALIQFIHREHAAGKRLVLVITGKGRHADDPGPIPVRRGVLRHQVPLWLSAPPLGQLVLQVAEAHRSHGGAGAFYVYLRRNR
jgi:DNA-nicking Smr family endonuclease